MPNPADAWNEVDHWRQMVRLVREYPARKYGAGVDGWTLRLSDGRESIEPFPALTAEELLGAVVPTDELMELIRQWAAERWPNRPARRVTIELADGDKVKMPIPDVPYRPTAPNPPRSGN